MGGRKALEGLTTTDICNKFVMPATKDCELSYCDMIFEKAKQSATTQLDRVVKTATPVFISHAWKYKFLDVLDALEDHSKTNQIRLFGSTWSLITNKKLQDYHTNGGLRLSRMLLNSLAIQ